MKPTIVVVDADVLYSRTLRDWVLQYALRTSIYVLKWTEDILAETLNSLRNDHPGWDGAVILRIREKVVGSLRIEHRIEEYPADPNYRGKDPGDAHIHAAAIACGADIVLTCNGSDFLPMDGSADDLPYEIYGPDDFLLLVDQSSPESTYSMIAAQMAYFYGKYGSCDLPGFLKLAGAPRFAEKVRQRQLEADNLGLLDVE